MPKKGGKGAKVSGVIKLSKGDKLAILLSQKGSTQDIDRATFVYRSPNKHKLYLMAGGGESGGKEVGLPGNDSPDGSGSVDTRGTNGVVVRFVEMQTLYHTLGLGLVILIIITLIVTSS